MSNKAIQLSKGKSSDAILIVYSGGTFGMKPNAEGVNEPFPLTELTLAIPELLNQEYTMDLISKEKIKDSSDMNHEDWIEIALILQSKYDEYKGFVVVHGTDTMIYTATAMSFLLQGLEKSIVFTGSQIPLFSKDTDAKDNLLASIDFITQKIQNQAKKNEVYICFGGELLRANRTIKTSVENLKAFESPNHSLEKEKELPLKQKQFYTNLSTEVALFKYFPSCSNQLVSSILKVELHKVVIIESFGAGNLPYSQEFEQLVKNYVTSGGYLFLTSQCMNGAINQNLYQSGNWMSKIGVVGLGDMTSECALVKVMFLLANGKIDDMTYNIVGELSV